MEIPVHIKHASPHKTFKAFLCMFYYLYVFIFCIYVLYHIFYICFFKLFIFNPAGQHNIFYSILSCPDNYFPLYLYLLYINKSCQST